ncbi:MAG: hypothetical protein JJV99_07785 [Colwellia sp.]|nr:hypothetical protein [Colwellia sp.]
MATGNKFECFVGDVGNQTHDLNTDTLRVYLTNAVPSTSADSVKADLAEITAQNGYTAGGGDVQNAWSEAAGVGTLTGVDYEWTAAGGSFGPFQYVVLYNDTAASDNLICWWDYGSALTVNDGEKFTADFGASILTLT